jgi:hypothetical protein
MTVTSVVKSFCFETIAAASPQKFETLSLELREDLRKVRNDSRIERRTERDGPSRKRRWHHNNLRFQSRNFSSQLVEFRRKLLHDRIVHTRRDLRF